MEQHFAFFDDIREKMSKGNALFITYWAKKKFERLRIKKMKAAEKAAANNKKYGSRGPPKKKGTSTTASRTGAAAPQRSPVVSAPK